MSGESGVRRGLESSDRCQTQGGDGNHEDAKSKHAVIFEPCARLGLAGVLRVVQADHGGVESMHRQHSGDRHWCQEQTAGEMSLPVPHAPDVIATRTECDPPTGSRPSVPILVGLLAGEEVGLTFLVFAA
jgi:hypothetical protein